jgi:uncharacterized protein (DUF1778 family)
VKWNLRIGHKRPRRGKRRIWVPSGWSGIRKLLFADRPQPTARLEARLPNEVLTRLKRAAEIQGQTFTDFVVAAAGEAACRAIEQTEILRLSAEDQRQIAKAILNPPKPTPALRRAARRYRKLFGVA